MNMEEVRKAIREAIALLSNDEISLCEAERMIGEVIFDETSAIQGKKRSMKAERECWRIAWRELLRATE